MPSVEGGVDAALRVNVLSIVGDLQVEDTQVVELVVEFPCDGFEGFRRVRRSVGTAALHYAFGDEFFACKVQDSSSVIPPS